MRGQLQRDQTIRPELFDWNGAIPKERLEEWLRDRQLRVPLELMELWRDTGGGDLFEGETILGPFGDSRLGDDVDSVNEYHRRLGMDRAYLIVHVGSALTAVRLQDQKWVVLDPATYAVTDEYESLESWYENVLRSEFAPRYGLPPSDQRGPLPN